MINTHTHTTRTHMFNQSVEIRHFYDLLLPWFFPLRCCFFFGFKTCVIKEELKIDWYNFIGWRRKKKNYYLAQSRQTTSCAIKRGLSQFRYMIFYNLILFILFSFSNVIFYFSRRELPSLVGILLKRVNSQWLHWIQSEWDPATAQRICTDRV